MKAFVKVARINEVARGAMKLARVDGQEIVIANVQGDILAFTNECPHAGCSLAEEGQLDSHVLECTCHGSRFNVRTGEVLDGPAEDPLTLYSVRLEGQDILVGP